MLNEKNRREGGALSLGFACCCLRKFACVFKRKQKERSAAALFPKIKNFLLAIELSARARSTFLWMVRV